jgi:hypothetical protein
VFDPAFTSINALGGIVTEQSASSTIELEWNQAEFRYVNADLDADQVTPGETYDLSIRGAGGLPDIDLEDVFPVPDHWELITPAIATSMPDVTADQHFEWTTEEDGDAVIMQVGLQTADGLAFDEELF